MRTLTVLAILPLLGFHGSAASCRLPPDFWCDHPVTALKCTGSHRYCDAYKRNRRGLNVADVSLAFEAGCPDSQQFVVHRLYPQVLSQPHYSGLVSVKSVPWGLAKRLPDQQVKCHHGMRECMANRWISCALLYYQHDQHRQHHLLYCYMQRMAAKQDPWFAMDECLNYLYTPLPAKFAIEMCGRGEQGSQLQRIDESETGRILPAQHKHFVPFIGINGRSHVHMQAYQLILAEKLRAWNATLNMPSMPTPASGRSISSRCRRQHSPSSCHSAPDFWCSDATITYECFSMKGCGEYLRGIYGKPIQLRVLYNPLQVASRSYVLEYVKPHLLTSVSAPFNPPLNDLNSAWTEIAGKYTVELEPMPSPDATLSIEECVFGSAHDTTGKTHMLLCLLEARSVNRLSMRDAWLARCAPDAETSSRIVSCADGEEWRELARQHASRIAALQPELPSRVPWLILNGYSLTTVQEHQNILHRMLCLWYRGPRHDRDKCARCEYEPTHC